MKQKVFTPIMIALAITIALGAGFLIFQAVNKRNITKAPIYNHQVQENNNANPSVIG